MLYDRSFLSGSFRNALRTRLGLYLGMASSWLVVEGLLIATGFSTGRRIPALRWNQFTWWSYLWTQPAVLAHYLRLTFWPSGLCLDYAWPPAGTLGEIVTAVATDLESVGGNGLGAGKASAIGFVGACFFLILSPTSSFVPTLDAAVEHRMYLPLAAVVTGVVIGGHLGGRWLIARGVVSRRAGRDTSMRWRGSVGEHRLRDADLPSQYRLFHCGIHLGRCSRQEAQQRPGLRQPRPRTVRPVRFNEAIIQSRKALELNPDYYYAHNNLGGGLLN